MDDDEIKDRQLNALVGGALRGLVESGADDEAVGAFAASYRQKAAKILGRPLEALNPPDLKEVIKLAVAEALADGQQAHQAAPKKSRKQNEHFTAVSYTHLDVYKRQENGMMTVVIMLLL